MSLTRGSRSCVLFAHLLSPRHFGTRQRIRRANYDCAQHVASLQPACAHLPVHTLPSILQTTNFNTRRGFA
eukprot:241230-Pyramimonas_sp.AAC.1